MTPRLVVLIAVFMVGTPLAAASSVAAQTAPPPAADGATPPACDPANANAADAGCKAPAPGGATVAPQSDTGQRRTCETMDGSKVEWSQPNVPFGVTKCEPTDAPPAPAPHGK